MRATYMSGALDSLIHKRIVRETPLGAVLFLQVVGVTQLVSATARTWWFAFTLQKGRLPDLPVA